MIVIDTEIIIPLYLDLGTPSIQFCPSKEVVAGSNVSMNCYVRGSNIDKIEWKKNDITIVSNSSQLDILNVNEGDAGKYKCLVYNGDIMKTSEEEIFSVTCKYLRIPCSYSNCWLNP